MSFLQSYRLRLRRRRWELRSLRKFRELTHVSNKTSTLSSDAVVLLSTIRNEFSRLPFFLQYYRDLGVSHFLFIDNDSQDETHDFLKQQDDVSVWHTKADYKAARFGMDWITALQNRYCVGHWTLVVDVDEFFVYPFCDTRPITALTSWLDDSDVRSFGAMLLDMYPKGPLSNAICVTGQNPLDVAPWFDAGNYTFHRNDLMGNLWIQGGVRARCFFADKPANAPALNKVPLVKWQKGYVYDSSTHMLLPRGLNLVYDFAGGEKTSGVLLHTKFLGSFGEKITEEQERKQHYSQSREYLAYQKQWENQPELWNRWSEKYINWRQLEILGLISKGNWA
ncbi:glycosyltransferase family 2 protein [Rhodobacteraceae bacterium]|nr:glycosyltransferase family 2 protein [Paracoccaceae bacterium]